MSSYPVNLLNQPEVPKTLISSIMKTLLGCSPWSLCTRTNLPCVGLLLRETNRAGVSGPEKLPNNSPPVNFVFPSAGRQFVILTSTVPTLSRFPLEISSSILVTVTEFENNRANHGAVSPLCAVWQKVFRSESMQRLAGPHSSSETEQLFVLDCTASRGYNWSSALMNSTICTSRGRNILNRYMVVI